RPTDQPHALLRDPHRTARRHLHRTDRTDHQHARALQPRRRRRLHARRRPPLVDRPFNRPRYDAEATVAAFTARLRDAVEIDAIRADLLDAVTRAVQPTHASVWIKPHAR